MAIIYLYLLVCGLVLLDVGYLVANMHHYLKLWHTDYCSLFELSLTFEFVQFDVNSQTRFLRVESMPDYGPGVIVGPLPEPEPEVADDNAALQVDDASDRYDGPGGPHWRCVFWAPNEW